jgi:16S rRNA (guanine966-N2)-methyltransferase
MRIVAGEAKGRKLAPVPEGVRPVSDRAREGIFASLGPDRIAEAAVLDLFAGTGAMALEACSRGAERALIIERSRAARRTIERNLGSTGFADRCIVAEAEVGTFLQRPSKPGAPFDLVFCDPPYEMAGPELDRIMASLVDGWLAPGTDWTLVLTRGEVSSMPVIPIQWAPARHLRYGGSHVTLIREVPWA